MTAKKVSIITMPNMIKNILSIIIVIVALFMYIRYIERHSIYFPMKIIETCPDVIGLSYKEVSFRTDDGCLLNGWFITNKDAEYTLLFFHGNAGNISHRLEKINIFYNLGLSIFIFDYRGYGKSHGSPSEKGLYQDAEAAYRYLIKERNISADNIILYGESLGGAVAIELASRQNVKALITEEAFSSVKDMVRIIYPFLPPAVLQSRFDSISKIKDIKAPKLIIHSIDDEIVPFSLGEKLFQAASVPKEFLKIRGGHNTAFLDSEEAFKSGIKNFLKK